MIIVSQDKTKLFNFNNVNLIKVIDDGRIISFDNTYQYNSDVIGDLLGQYKTEERAKEVLQEIINKYSEYSVDECSAVTVFPKVYIMPEE